MEPYDLDEHERVLLVECCYTIDMLEELRSAVKRDGLLLDSPQGTKIHPAVPESRQLRITLARMLSALRLPAGEDGDLKAGARPQRRSGARGTYGIRVVS